MLVMIVEDDADMSELMRYIVSGMGLQTEQFYDGTSAIRRLTNLRKEKPSLMILDLHLPGVSGWDIFDAAWKLGILVAVVTADVVAARKFVDRADAVFTKPWNTMEFMAKLTSLIARAEVSGEEQEGRE